MSMMHFCGEDTCAQDPLCCEHGDPCDETMCPASAWYGMTAKEIDAMYDPEPEDELAEDIYD